MFCYYTQDWNEHSCAFLHLHLFSQKSDSSSIHVAESSLFKGVLACPQPCASITKTTVIKQIKQRWNRKWQKTHWLRTEPTDAFLSGWRCCIFSKSIFWLKTQNKTKNLKGHLGGPVGYTSAQVTIARFTSSNPASGSVLTAQGLEPASDAVSPSLSAPPLLVLCLSLSKINKH